MSETLLTVSGLDAGYGDFQALFDVALDLEAGAVLALIGANGAGKSTLLKAITGLVPPRRGRVRYRGRALERLPAHDIARLGIAMVPEGRRLFPSLSVEENLLIGGRVGRSGRWSLARVYELFPMLAERRHSPAPALSGGQQQMVAIGRALMANPELILFDEISLGLAPIVIRDIFAALPGVISFGVSAILVEQDISRALSVADRVVCLQHGRVSLTAAARGLSRETVTAAYFGVG